MTLQTPGPQIPEEPPLRAGDVLACGFAMTVAAWIVAYISRLPAINAPGKVTVLAMLAAVFLGGLFTARYAPPPRRGWVSALLAGAVSGLLNNLVVGSVLHDVAGNAAAASVSGPTPTLEVPAVALWVGGSMLCNIVVAGAGGLIGSFFPSPRRDLIRWTQIFAIVLAAATLPLISIGGFVTALRAGLAVPDWPQSYGYNMFLFPLSKMQSNQGKFLEHAHRLMGSLVGTTAVTIAVYATLTELRSFVKVCEIVVVNIVLVSIAAGASWMAVAHRGVGFIALAVATVVLAVASLVKTAVGLWNSGRTGRTVLLIWSIVAAVCAQGILGGTRVTERDTDLAIAHGVFAQLVFAGMACFAAVTSRSFVTLPRQKVADASMDRGLAVTLLAALVVQLILGALVRHENLVITIHITMAVFVAFLVLTCGVRAWGLHGALPPLKRAGIAIIALVALQIVLGLLALVFRAAPQETPTLEAASFTTAHQANGALLLAACSILTLWTWRLLTPEPQRETAASPVPGPA